MAQREARVAEAVHLRRDYGMSDTQIARQLGVSLRSVKRYFSQAMAAWRHAVPAKVELARAQAAAELRKIVEECWKEYERSKEPARKVIQEREAVEGLPPDKWPVTKTRTELIERLGDPRYLSEARLALAEHDKLYGLHREPEGGRQPEGGQTTVFNLIQVAQEAARPENLPVVLSADGTEMVRGPDGTPRLPGPNGKNGEQEQTDGGGK